MMLRPIATLMICTVVAFTSAPVRADEDLAAEALSEFAVAVEEVGSILRDTSASPDEKRSHIEYLLDRWLDMPSIVRSALGSHVESFSRDELIEFSQEFARYVSSVYTQRIARAQVDGFEVLGATWNDDSSTVVVRTAGGRPITTRTPGARGRAPSVVDVEYRLRNRRGDWRIVRITIGDVDVVRLFRDQFSSLLRRGDPNALIERLRTINGDFDESNPFAAAHTNRYRPSLSHRGSSRCWSCG